MITVFSEFKVMENFPQYQGFFMKFLDFIKEKEESYSGISSFLEFFEDIKDSDLYVNAQDEDSVKVTTIHKAKGLEFSIVIIPFLEMDVSVGSGSAGRNNPYVLKQYQDRSLSLIQLKKEYGSYSDSLRHEYKKEYIKSLIGELNTLYVALTRAKDEMYVFVPEKAGKTNNLAGILFPFEKYESGKKRQYISDVQEETPAMMLAPSSYSDWISVLKSESINVSALLNKDKILKGEIFHYILSCIGNLSEEDKIESLEVAGLKTHLMFPYSGDLEGYFKE